MSKRRDTIQDSRVTFCCLAFLVMSVIAYLYFLNVSVVHVVMRKEANQHISELQTEIAVLETAFIESQHTISQQIASLEGYTVDTAKIFITRDETSLVLRDN